MQCIKSNDIGESLYQTNEVVLSINTSTIQLEVIVNLIHLNQLVRCLKHKHITYIYILKLM